MNQPADATKLPKALLVDGDAARTAQYSEVLKNCGYAVIAADDLSNARMRLEADRYDVILCQEALKGGSGLELLKALPSFRVATPFLILADSPDAPAVAEALKLGAADAFTTPGDFTTLYPKLAALQAKTGAQPPGTAVHPVQLPEVRPGMQHSDQASVDMIMDVPIAVNAVLGSAVLQIAELLQLGPGSVIELNKHAGDPVDVYVNDRLIAMGEVVVVKESFGIRITEVIEPKQRVQALG